MIERLKWKAFLSTNGDDADFTAMVGGIISVMKHSNTEDAQCKLQQLIMSSEETLKSLHIFTEEHVQTSDQCKYLEGFLYLISLLKNLIRANREGNWNLYLKTLRMSFHDS